MMASSMSPMPHRRSSDNSEGSPVATASHFCDKPLPQHQNHRNNYSKITRNTFVTGYGFFKKYFAEI